MVFGELGDARERCRLGGAGGHAAGEATATAGAGAMRDRGDILPQLDGESNGQGDSERVTPKEDLDKILIRPSLGANQRHRLRC